MRLSSISSALHTRETPRGIRLRQNLSANFKLWRCYSYPAGVLSSKGVTLSVAAFGRVPKADNGAPDRLADIVTYAHT